MLSHANGLCDKLDAVLVRLKRANFDALPAGEVEALRRRVAQLTRRIDA